MKNISRNNSNEQAQLFAEKYAPLLLKIICKIKTVYRIPINKGKDNLRVDFTDTSSIFANKLLEDLANEDFLKEIMSADFEKQKKLMDIFKTKYSFDVDDTIDKNDPNVKKTLEFIFIEKGYENQNVFGKEDKLNFVKDTNLRVCPYCGRSYIFSVEKEKGYYLRPEIDHFLPKSIYPMFAMTFYNLIPSCRECNGLLNKGDKNPYKRATNTLEIMHPYNYRDEDLTFQFYSESPIVSDFLKYRIKILSKYKGYNEIFALEYLYRLHNIELSDMIKTYQKLNETYRDFLGGFRISNKYVEDVFMEMYHLGDNDEEDRLLSKFYKDMWKELKQFHE